MTMRKCGLRTAGALLLMMMMTAPSLSQITPKPLVPLVMSSEPGSHLFAGRHAGIFNGRSMRYRTEVSETIIKDGGGRPSARLYATAYLAEAVRNSAARPVMFAFNGGPGASAVFLQLGSLGPKIVKDIQFPGGPLIDNPQSPLDAVDLVFLDPPESGFSRILPGADRSQFASIDGDSAAMSQAVLNWLRSHNRLSSPVYIYGESYGTMRAVAMARDLRRGTPSIAVAGLMLGGNSLGYFQKGQMPDILFSANALPMMASVAWYHGKIDPKQSWAQAVDKARIFARTDYIAALMQGYQLPLAERGRIIARLHDLIGIPAETLRENGGIVPTNFKTLLLADQGLVVDGNDGRLTKPTGQKPGADAFSNLIAAYDTVMKAYATSELHVTGLDEFTSFNPVLLPDWNYYTSGSMALDVTLSQEMKYNRVLRVLLVQGRYDTLTTIGNSEYIMRQADLDFSRYGIAYYDGGHALLPEPEIMNALRNFMRSDAAK